MESPRFSALTVFAFCLRREWHHQRCKFLILTLAAVLFVAVLMYAGGSTLQIQTAEELPEYLKYKVSLVSEEADSIVIRVLRSQLAEMPFLSEVYVEDQEQARKRLAEGETLLCIRFPRGFIQAFQEGREAEPLHIVFNPAMPAEAARLQAILKNWLRALNLVRSDIYIWQELYEGYTGDRNGSYMHMTFQAMQSVGTFGQRYSFVELEERNHFVGQGFLIAGLVLLFSLLPALIFFDSRGRELDSVFQDRIDQVGASSIHFIAKLCMSFLLWAGLCLPLLYLARFLVRQVNLSVLTFDSFAIWLISLLLASAAACLDFSPATRAAVSWLALLLFLFFAGSIYPLELFPEGLRQAAVFSPFHALFESILAELSGEKATLLSGKQLIVLWPLLPAFLLHILAVNRRRQSR